MSVNSRVRSRSEKFLYFQHKINREKGIFLFTGTSVKIIFSASHFSLILLGSVRVSGYNIACKNSLHLENGL